MFKKIVKKTSKGLSDLKKKLKPNSPYYYAKPIKLLPPKSPPPKPLLPPSKMPSKKNPPPKPLLPPSKLPSKKLPPPKPLLPPSKLPSKKIPPPPSKMPSKYVKSPPKKQKSPVKQLSVKKTKQMVKKSPIKIIVTKPVKDKLAPESKLLPKLNTKDIKKMQRYTIMDPRDVWGSKIENMKDLDFVNTNAPKFAKVLDILKKEVFPSSRKDIAAKALIFVKNKKDGMEALATYLTSVGKMKPIDGTEDTDKVSKGNNLLIMGEVGEKSPIYKYTATTQKKSKGIISKFNENDNKIGDKYPVMLIHEKFLEGLDLIGVTHIILVQEPGSVGMFDQIIGRGVRNCSHKHLPSSLWKVKIISLVNVGEGMTPDEVIIQHRNTNTKIVESILSTSQSYSLDCSVSQKRFKLNCK